MIATPWERRAAERFNDLLENKNPPAHDEFSPLLALSNRVSSLSENMEPDPAFRDRFRTRLLAVAAVQGIGKTARDPEPEPVPRSIGIRQRLKARRVALVSATLAALLALSGVGVASSGAMPGDPLYGVKRSREAAQLALARSDVSRGQLRLDFARTRLKEAIRVQKDRPELNRALDDMDAETRSGMLELSQAAVERRSPAPLDIMDTFVGEQHLRLSKFIPDLSLDQRQRPLDSLALLEQIRERSSALRRSLPCTADYAGTNRSDELGPLPRSCSAAPRPTPGGQIAPTAAGPSISSSELPSQSDHSASPSESANNEQGLVSTSPNGGLSPSGHNSSLSGPSATKNPSTTPPASQSPDDDTFGGWLGSLLGSK